MRPGLVVSGVLGIGTVLVFGAAALVSAMFPNGTTVSAGWNGATVWGKGGMAMPGVAAPVPAPVVVNVDAGGGVVQVPAER